MFVVENGRAEGAPVIFLHGFGMSADVWSDVQASLAEQLPTLAYDLPGHGRSLDVDIVRTGKMAGAITQDLAARGISRVHLVGHSMGGAIATLIALRNPDLVASMTLLAPGGYGPEINHRLLRRHAAATERDGMLGVLENMFGWNCAIPAALVDRLMESRNVLGAAERLDAILDSMLKRRGGGLEQGTFRRDALAQLTMPVKVLWGTQDRVLPTRQAHRLPPLFAAHVFEDTGHMLIEERGDAAVWLIRQNIRAGVDQK